MDAELLKAATLIDSLRSRQWRGRQHLASCAAVSMSIELPCSPKCAEAARIVAAVAARAQSEQGQLFEEVG